MADEDGHAAEEADPVEKIWARFIQHLELARNYDGVYQLELFRKMPNPVADAMLPTLLFLDLIGLLDDALESYRDSQGLKFPRNARHDLSDRIKLLSEGLLNPRLLHELRETRNKIAHALGTFIDWRSLDEALNTVEEELRHLQLVGSRPEYKFFSERSAAKDSDDPNYAFQFEYEYGLKEKGRTVVSFSWTDRVARSDSI